ncbi:MAG: hypothetical protein Unbinned2514contig1000_43 [Prokaryotic dsDNA virus sp.]|nr:MAG: hypothetical protein Unbinned2514contig1000_43 [Prokaryotic dsDNA virus sp.]|tara:strand:- start:11303 stop:11620 length:318 start_codon:yes stop_codon:yes gene_type:complete
MVATTVIEFDPIIARTLVVPEGEKSDAEGFSVGSNAVLISLGRDVNGNHVSITTNRINQADFCLLFPTTTVGIATLLTRLINAAYMAYGPADWSAMLTKLNEETS